MLAAVYSGSTDEEFRDVTSNTFPPSPAGGRSSPPLRLRAATARAFDGSIVSRRVALLGPLRLSATSRTVLLVAVAVAVVVASLRNIAGRDNTAAREFTRIHAILSRTAWRGAARHGAAMLCARRGLALGESLAT